MTVHPNTFPHRGPTSRARRARDWRFFMKWCLALVALAGSLAVQTLAPALDLTVLDDQGTSVSGYRWLLQEDRTFPVTPGVNDPNMLAFSFHSSYSPPVATSHTLTSTATIALPDTTKRYFLSVLPDADHQMSGAKISGTDLATTVVVNRLPIPTAQIAVLIFHDNAPVNNAPDATEPGLAGFRINLVEAGGRYGMSGGPVMQDAFGHMIGTTYDDMGNPLQEGSGFVLSDANGLALIKNLSPGKYTIFVTPPTGENWSRPTSRRSSSSSGRRAITSSSVSSSR